jgi:hypothetical protein
MKQSFFNPEVHSLPFANFYYYVCGAKWGAVCGGMCCMVLSKFYKGELVDCEMARGPTETDIWNLQVGIIGCDIYKSCRWGRSMTAVDKIYANIAVGKPTLLYLDLKDNSLADDHFVVAHAIDDSDTSKRKIYIYDPNFVYKRHYCGNPTQEYCDDPSDPGSRLYWKNSYLEVNYTDQSVALVNRGSSERVLGFKWYGEDNTGIQVSYYTDERDVQHSFDMELVSTNPPEILKTIPLISHNIKVSKEGTVPADLTMYGASGEYYQSGNNLIPRGLESEFDSFIPYNAIQTGSGSFEKTLKVYQRFESSYTPYSITLKSNYLEKSLELSFSLPALRTFTAFVHGRNPGYRDAYENIVDDPIISITDLAFNDVQQVELASETDQPPVNRVYTPFTEDDVEEAKRRKLSIFDPIIYLGYIKSDVNIELTHNGLYTGATVKLSYGSSSTERPFTGNAVTFDLPGGNQQLYAANAMKDLRFDVIGGGISSKFSNTFHATLQYRCLIIHTPNFPDPHQTEFDVFARYFEEILIHIPHSPRVAELENRFNRELEKNTGVDKEKYKKIFTEELIKAFSTRAKTMGNRKKILGDFITCYRQYDAFRKQRIGFIMAKSKNIKELNQNLKALEIQMRPLIGRALIQKKTFMRMLTEFLKSEWK